MLSELYTAIQNRVNEKLKGTIKHFDAWNKQIYFESVEKPFWTPALFVELESINWDINSLNTQLENETYIQSGEAIVNFWLVFQSKADNLDIIHNVIAPTRTQVLNAFNGYDLGGIGQMVRIAEEQDTEHDNVIYWKITFKVTFTERLDNADLQAANVDFDLIVTMPIEEPNFRVNKLQ